MEEKIKQLSYTIVHYSLKIKEGETVLISYQTEQPRELVKKLILDITDAGGIPFVSMTDPEVSSLLSMRTTDARIKLIKLQREFEVNQFDAFISLRCRVNDYEDKNVDTEIIKKLGKSLLGVQDTRINHRKWVLLNYPSTLDAYKAAMTISDFRNFAFNVMCIDYQQMEKDISPLKKLMDKTDMVHIVGPNTDLTFSIKGMKSIPCVGKSNIPDGEIYTAPIKNSVNGIITYNTPSPYQGMIFHHVSLTFKDGRIIHATSDEGEAKLNEIFNMDEGARFIGEFSLGFHPNILHPMGDILYDEKILGSFHFTPGRAYKDCYNGNDSSVHWDMVSIQRSDYGGGEIFFDDVLIRKNGLFVLPELKHLNYDYDLKRDV